MPVPIPILRNDNGEIISVPTLMNYITKDTTDPCIRRDKTGSDGAIENNTWDETEVPIHNGRLCVAHDKLTLDNNGFQLADHPIKDQHVDFYDQTDIVKNYYPMCQQLLERSFGCDGVKAYAFDHNVRSDAERRDLDNAGDSGAAVQNPIRIVHADYTRDSAPNRMEQLTEQPKANDIMRQFLKEGQSLLQKNVVRDAVAGQRRYLFINVWRNISAEHPVLQKPLACMDARTTTFDHLRVLKIHYADRVGENYFCCHHKNYQKWYYFPNMTIDEAILLKTWDSSGGIATGKTEDLGGLSSFSIHSAFVDPSSPKDAPPRESIETRCVVIFPPDNVP